MRLWLSRSSEAVQLLIAKGAHVNVFTADSVTALMMACQKSRLDVVKVLLENGADLSSFGQFGDTGFDYAMDIDDKELLTVMLAAGALKNVDSSRTLEYTEPLPRQYDISPSKVHQSVVNGEELQLLVEIDKAIRAGMSLLDRNYTLLMAISFKSYRLVRGLLEREAEVNCKTLLGRTPLHLAARRRDDSVLNLLLAYNARADVKDERGLTPLHIALKQGIPAYDMIISLLKIETLFNSSLSLQKMSDPTIKMSRISGELSKGFSFSNGRLVWSATHL